MRAAKRQEWVMVGGTLALSVLLFLSRGRPAAAGSVIEAPITVTPEDEAALGCELGRAIGTHRCAYQSSDTRFSPPSAPRDLLQPFMTTERVLFLVPGLFQDPAVRTHLERQISGARFTARCRLRLLERVSDFEFRFHDADPWIPGKEPTWVGEPLTCVVE